MRASSLDHLVVVAPTLAAGAQYVEERLGVAMQPGGKHPRMGTHNLLLRLGDCYLEVIAPDPDAPPPTRPRWFGLDELGSDAEPRLAHWVARTRGLAEADARLMQTFGRIESMSRGTLAWQISIHADGQLPLSGVLPSLIDWGDARHPRGCADRSGLPPAAPGAQASRCRSARATAGGDRLFRPRRGDAWRETRLAGLSGDANGSEDPLMANR